MAQYSKKMQGEFISNGSPQFIPLPFVPESFNFVNKTKWNTTTNNTAVSGFGYSLEKPSTTGTNGIAPGDTYALASNGTTLLGKTLTAAGSGVQFISAGTPTFGAVVQATSPFIAAGATTTITSASHPYKVGDTILLFGVTSATAPGGFVGLSGIPYVVLTVTTNSFTISANTSAITDTATAASMMLVQYPDLYIPFGAVITAMTLGNPTVVTTTTSHYFQVGSQVRFQIPKISTGVSPWGPTALDGVKGFVTAVTAQTVTVNVNSTGFTAFAYPTNANAPGSTPAMLIPIGDQNFGIQTATPPPLPYVFGTSIAGAFQTNTRQGVLLGTGDGTVTLHANNDVLHWEAEFPDKVLIQ